MFDTFFDATLSNVIFSDSTAFDSTVSDSTVSNSLTTFAAGPRPTPSFSRQLRHAPG